MLGQVLSPYTEPELLTRTRPAPVSEPELRTQGKNTILDQTHKKHRAILLDRIRLCCTIYSLGLDFGERTWANPGWEFGFGVLRRDYAEPWFGRFGERNILNLSSAGLEFEEITWPNPGFEFGFGERNMPNPVSAGSKFRERNELNLGSAGSEFGVWTWVRVRPKPFSELPTYTSSDFRERNRTFSKLGTRVCPGSLSEIGTCRTKVQPCLFSELRTGQGSEFGERYWPFSKLRTCRTWVRPSHFFGLGTCKRLEFRERDRPFSKPAQPKFGHVLSLNP